MPLRWWLLCLCLVVGGVAADGLPLDDWRAELAQARRLSENDVPRARASVVRLLDRLPADATPIDKAGLLNLRARIEMYLGHSDEAALLAQQAFELARERGDKGGMAESDLTTAVNSVYLGRIDTLISVTTRSMAEVEGLNRPDLMGEALLRASMMYRRLGQVEDSVALAMSAMAIARRSGDPLALTFAHQGLAISYDLSFRHQEAGEQYRQMLEQARAAHSKQLAAYATAGLGGSKAALDGPAAGEPDIRDALKLFREFGAPVAVNFGLSVLANNLRLQKRHAEAAVLLDEVVASYEQGLNRIGLWFSLNSRSSNHQAMGDFNLARADAQRAYQLAKDINFPLYVSESAVRLASISAAAGNYREAHALLLESNEMTARASREKSSQRMLELTQRYESESQRREVEQLTQRNREQDEILERQHLRQQWLTLVLAVTAAGLAVAAGLLWRLRRIQRDLERHTSILTSVLDSMADGVLVADAQNKLVLVNPMGAQILGIDVAHDVGSPLGGADRLGLFLADRSSLCPADQLPWSQALAGRPCDHAEMFLLNASRPEGAWLSITARPLSTAAGVPRGSVAVFSDITARKQAEEALRRREHEFRALVENTPDFVSRFDRECRRVYTNPALPRALGITAESMLGALPSRLPGLSPEQAAEYERRMRATLETGADGSVELALRTAAGETLAYQVRLVAERDEAGQVVSVLAIGRDMTMMLRTQRQLSTLLENLPDMIARFDRQGRFLYVNPAYSRVYGMPAERFTGQTWRALGLHSDELQDAMQRAIDDARPNVVELRWPGAPGERYFEVRHVPEMDDGNEVQSVLAIVREVTERKRTEQLVRDLGFRREAAREDERRVIARELHDELGQTLSALRLEVSLLRMRHGQTDSGVAERAASMLVLVDSVIGVQRDLVASLRPAVLDMGIGPALEWLVGELVEHAGIEGELQMSEAQLDLDTDQTTMVFRIVQESLTNVARHAKASRVEVALRRHVGGYTLSVQDNGRGFDPAAARQPKSFGLIGLNERAEMLGGRLQVTSSRATGTRIVVNFPARLATLAAPAERIPDAHSSEPDGQFSAA